LENFDYLISNKSYKFELKFEYKLTKNLDLAFLINYKWTRL